MSSSLNTNIANSSSLSLLSSLKLSFILFTFSLQASTPLTIS
jgi:hypothetical protein